MKLRKLEKKLKNMMRDANIWLDLHDCGELSVQQVVIVTSNTSGDIQLELIFSEDNVSEELVMDLGVYLMDVGHIQIQRGEHLLMEANPDD